jgi:hypothetical protein
MLAGCGAHAKARPAALVLEREDLVAVTRALERLRAPIATEVAATKLAWPLVVDGLPTTVPASMSASITAASEGAAHIKLPALLEETQAAALTGPASEIASLMRTSIELAARAWELIAAAVGEIQRGSPTAARFARENVALYIESVYDGHFALSQVGKKLLDAYRKLGGPTAFATSLTAPVVDALALTYSEGTDRIYPHSGVRLGS